MRHILVVLSCMLSSAALFAQAPAPLPATAVSAGAIDCDAVWQTAQAVSERGRQLVSIKRWKEAADLFTEAAAGAHQVSSECPAYAKAAAALETGLAAEFKQANGHFGHQTVCEPALDRAFDADIKASLARREGRDLNELDKLLLTAKNAWQVATESCADSYKLRAERSYKAAQKAYADNAELLSGGPACDGAWKNAVALNDLAKDAKKAKRWDEATNLYEKAHMAWERVAQHCAGSRQQSAAQKIEDTQLDAHNAEYCGPQWDDANDALAQLNKAKAASVPFAERDLLMVKTEVLWREAINLCRGDSKVQARMMAEAIARERGAPLPPNALVQHGKNRVAPVAASVASAVAPAPASTPVKAAPVAVASAAVPVAAVAPAAPSPAASKPQPVAPVKPAEPGVIVAGDTIFRGNFENIDGKVNGEGLIEWASGDVYRGAVVAGLRHGKGRMTWKSGQWQEGEWRDNVGVGKAVVFFPDGNRYEGSVLNGLPQGQGTMIFTSGDRYVGNFEQGAFHGAGTYYWKSGANYRGDWVLGQKHGTGRMTMADGSGWEGDYQNDQETKNVRRFKAAEK